MADDYDEPASYPPDEFEQLEQAEEALQFEAEMDESREEWLDWAVKNGTCLNCPI